LLKEKKRIGTGTRLEFDVVHLSRLNIVTEIKNFKNKWMTEILYIM